MKVTHGEMTSIIAVPRWASEALRIGRAAASCRRRTSARRSCAPSWIGQHAGVDRRQVVDHAVLERRPDVGGRRELPLGQAVAAVVLDDVDHRDVAAHHVHELADADRAGVAVAADADRDHLPVGEQGAGADRRHPAVHGVEAVRVAEEVGRALARAADARQLDHVPRMDAHLEERVDDALGDGVVAAAGAQRRLAAAIRLHLEPDAVLLLAGVRRGRCGFHGCYSADCVWTVAGAAATTGAGAFFPSCTRMSSVSDRASIGRPL